MSRDDGRHTMRLADPDSPRGLRLQPAWRVALLVTLLVLTASTLGCSPPADTGVEGEGVSGPYGGRKIVVFAGSASKPPAEKAAQLFEQRTGATVELAFGGSGTMLSEMEIAEHGDIYFPGSSDWMEVAKDRELVNADSERRVVYLVNSINVQAGNPKDIHTLEDLLRPGVRVIIANPETVCVGAYAVEILEKNLSADQIARFREQNLVNWSESCEKTANAISLRAADVVIGWSVFEDWDPQRIETIDLPAEQLVRIAYIPIAVSTYASDPELAAAFIDFVTSDTGLGLFEEAGYFVKVEDAQDYVGSASDLPVGGWYQLPETWLRP